MGLSSKAPVSTVSTTVASIFRRKRALVQSVWDKYAKEDRVTVKALPWNSQSKINQQRVPKSKMIIFQITELIRKRSGICERLVAKDITMLLWSLVYLVYFQDGSLSILRDTLVIFEGRNNHTKDYNGISNNAYFVGWIHKLLDAKKTEHWEHYHHKQRQVPQKFTRWHPMNGLERKSYLTNEASEASRCHIKA